MCFLLMQSLHSVFEDAFLYALKLQLTALIVWFEINFSECM
jgi:hypothetical protein